ncbi:hypothetical protein CONLIGDRAFT_635160 [Coniochaeta ligniaria NRRL 30616]|uniref:DUF1445-domain-containing protein n=1 Tax=Coniochaeta ligniaria NRRL 30616 TaxID=1408157 RepID=A0A1J7J0U4_9PEZI|nr:hypothetical protein CONLIGDRAFT_635160 [Coniochaeta ligniaria NRRL 30616]
MSPESLPTGLAVRLASRTGALTTVTSGLAPTHLQANLIVLPSRYASDFRLLCARNPVPCPLLAESSAPGSFSTLTTHLLSSTGTPVAVASDIDLRRDAPAYRVYRDGKLVSATEPKDVIPEWTEDHVGFLIGCSYSFETALTRAGLPPRHITLSRNVAMYRTTVPLCAAGIFAGGTYVVSMRPYRPSEIETVRAVTRPFVQTHGEPIAWGWEGAKQLGIKDISKPEWGDVVLGEDGETVFTEQDEEFVPVFWGCGVTPQNAVMMAGLEGTVMGHAPGYMIVLDVREEDVFGAK